jgi:hypothetical protein
MQEWSEQGKKWLTGLKMHEVCWSKMGKNYELLLPHWSDMRDACKQAYKVLNILNMIKFIYFYKINVVSFLIL